MKRGEIWWADVGEPSGSEPGFRRPAVIVSANSFNATPIRTVIVVFLTTNAALGMDISGTTGILYMSHDDPNTITPMSLYTVNTSTGIQTQVGAYGGGLFVADISVQIAAVPEPATYLMALSGLAGLLTWCRRRPS